ncbi:energy transducer TonB [Teredinibacter haidensis]|uniref:energy transducer TonB n=1 Tax=Teredinibacter haidensis TaxID=2731755 RepID=UPI00094897B2|nr:energy transducer TonB [Teredinibacter haidensis]
MSKNLINNTPSVFMATEVAESSLGRWLQVLPLAAIITFCLLIFMERLIAMADVELEEEAPHIIDNIYWEPTVIETRREEMARKPQEPMDKPELPEEIPSVTPGIKTNLPRSNFSVKPQGKLQVSMFANIPIAQYLATARYPSTALTRGIEGYVDIMFDVTEYGGTDNIRVAAAEPEGIFEKAAMKAVAKWRFQPKMYEDKPVRFEGMMRRVRFEMEK